MISFLLILFTGIGKVAQRPVEESRRGINQGGCEMRSERGRPRGAGGCPAGELKSGKKFAARGLFGFCTGLLPRNRFLQILSMQIRACFPRAGQPFSFSYGRIVNRPPRSPGSSPFEALYFESVCHRAYYVLH